jgi:hypothetical protein
MERLKFLVLILAIIPLSLFLYYYFFIFTTEKPFEGFPKLPNGMVNWEIDLTDPEGKAVDGDFTTATNEGLSKLGELSIVEYQWPKPTFIKKVKFKIGVREKEAGTSTRIAIRLIPDGPVEIFESNQTTEQIWEGTIPVNGVYSSVRIDVNADDIRPTSQSYLKIYEIQVFV